MAYPTLANLKTALKITDTTADDNLQLALDMAITWCEDFTGRNWSDTPIDVVDEEYDLDSITQTNDASFIMLRQMDIQAVSDVKLGDQSIGADDYKFTPEGRLTIYGRVFDLARRAFNDYQWVKVSYSYGAVTPKAVEGAILMLAMAYWNDMLAMNNTTQADGVGNNASSDTAKSERVGEVSITYGGGNQSATNGAENLIGTGEKSTGTINSISRMLNSYRKRRV